MNNQIENFLNTIFNEALGNIELRAIEPNKGLIDRLFTRSMNDINHFVLKHLNSANIYFGVCTRKPDSSTGTKNDIYETSSYWADMDFKDYGQEQGKPIDLKKGEVEARKILATFPSQPSAIINTGGGLQLYWFFDLQNLDNIEVLESTLREVCSRLQSDKSAAEIARVLRLPGTINFPDRKKIEKGGRLGPLPVVIECLEERKYNFNEFTNFYKTKESPKENKQQKTKIRVISFEDVEEKLESHLEKNIVLQATWFGNRNTYKDSSRSGHDMALASNLAKIGFTPEETKAVLKKFPLGKGETDGTERYFDHTVSKAFNSMKKSAEQSQNSLESFQNSESTKIFEDIFSEINKTPELVEMSEIEESEPSFLVKPYILADAVTILAGDGGGGKSQIALTYTAEISLKGNICIFSNEDKPGTIRKRLNNQGADNSKVFHCSKEFDLSSREGQILMINFLYQRNPLLIIIDSLTSYSGNKDLNKSGDVRQIINFLNTVARYFKCAALVILHLNKGDGKSMYKISGSVQIVAAARSVLIAGCKPKDTSDPEGESIGAIFHIKANESEKGKPIGYSLRTNGLRWIETNLKISDILASDTQKIEDHSALTEAKEFIIEKLKHGPKKVVEIKEEAKNLGIAGITLQRAKVALQVKSFIDTKTFDKPCGFWKLVDDHVIPNLMINDQET